jgi:nucleotide-binding universal stress UspA family protein
MKILVALDGSTFAEAVLEPVARLATDAKAQVFLVQVVEPSRVHSIWIGSPEYYAEAAREEYSPHGVRIREADYTAGRPRVAESCEQALKRAVQAARDYLHHVASRFAPVRPAVVVLVGDEVDEQLARFAREREVDLIAMASHGRTGLARLLMGNHASNMLRHRVAPVMIVRPDGLREEINPTSEKAPIT